jgi:hypothetical protein
MIRKMESVYLKDSSDCFEEAKLIKKLSGQEKINCFIIFFFFPFPTRETLIPQCRGGGK